jgi:hypothetical protein
LGSIIAALSNSGAHYSVKQYKNSEKSSNAIALGYPDTCPKSDQRTMQGYNKALDVQTDPIKEKS